MGWAPAKAGADGGEMGVVKRPSVSVVLPALNEEATVAAVIESVRPSLAAGIVDEIIVVDSDSTDATAEVAAAAGARVVKHGNRAASSACGTADCLEALGVVLDLPADKQPAVFAETGIVFLFASHYHPSLRHAAVPRRELGISTTFNFLGPLANPARPQAQAVGVADARMAGLMAGVLAGRGHRGMVFHGGDGLDELTTTTASDLWLFSGGRTVTTRLDPADLGIPRAEPADLVGGEPPVNAAIARETLAGKRGPVRDIVLLNAAAALLAFDGPDLDEPAGPQFAGRLERAAAAIDDGRATALLDRWVAVTQAARD